MNKDPSKKDKKIEFMQFARRAESTLPTIVTEIGVLKRGTIQCDVFQFS